MLGRRGATAQRTARVDVRAGAPPAEILVSDPRVTLWRFFGFEHGAEAIHTFTGALVPGLPQTRDYAQAVIETGSPWIRLAEADLRVEVRMLRQRRLTGDEPLRLTAVMSEAAVRQQIGGPAVLIAQLRHLAAMIAESDQAPVIVSGRPLATHDP